MAITQLHTAELHVSVSQVKTFLMCPHKYELRYVLGADPEKRSINLVFGSATLGESIPMAWDEQRRGLGAA